MLNEKILSFLKECKVNPDLQQKLGKLAPEDMEGLIKIAGEAGFDFTAEEWTEYEKSPIAKNSELTEDELDKVSGGGLFGDCPKQYSFLLCKLSFCPHFKSTQTDKNEYVESCDNGYFSGIKAKSNPSENYHHQ